MRNVVKGFQVSKLAMPKIKMAKINKQYDIYHSPSVHRAGLRPGKQATAKNAGRPGKNPGTGRGMR